MEKAGRAKTYHRPTQNKKKISGLVSQWTTVGKLQAAWTNEKGITLSRTYFVSNATICPCRLFVKSCGLRKKPWWTKRYKNKQTINWMESKSKIFPHTHTHTHVKGSHFLINEHTRAELFTITPGRQSFAPMQSKTARPEVPSPSDDCSLHWHCIKLLDKHKINCKNKTQTHRSKTILNWSNECATKP